MQTSKLLLVLALAGADLAAQSVPVCYDGVVGEEARARRVIVEMTSNDAGTLHYFSRPARRMDLQRTGATGEFASRGDTARVTRTHLSALQLSLRTTRDTQRSTLPHASAVAGAGYEGEWSTAVGVGGTVRMIIRIENGPCGLLVGWIDSPDQGQRDLPLTMVRSAGDSVVLEAAYLGIRIVMMNGSDTERHGRMTQHGTTRNLILQRGSSQLLRPQHPAPPFPYESRDVQFQSRGTHVVLHGTLTWPSSRGPHPAAVLISGSGAQDRDETVAGHRPFLVLADFLTRQGVAVLRFDDRSLSGGSTAALVTTLGDIARDVGGALDYLRNVPEVDATRIALVGHSEGGYIAPMLAARDSAIAAVVLLAAPAVGGRALFEAQTSTLFRAGGGTEAEVRVDSLIRAAAFDAIAVSASRTPLAQRVDSVIRTQVASMNASDRTIAESWLTARTAAQDSASIALWQSAWFTSLFAHPAEDYLTQVQVPVLAVYGSLDLQVPPSQSIRALEQTFRSRRGLLTVSLLPGVNHMLQPAVTGRMEEYLHIEQTIDGQVLEVLGRWLTTVFRLHR